LGVVGFCHQNLISALLEELGGSLFFVGKFLKMHVLILWAFLIPLAAEAISYFKLKNGNMCIYIHMFKIAEQVAYLQETFFHFAVSPGVGGG
jgi:hypothetical protein